MSEIALSEFGHSLKDEIIKYKGIPYYMEGDTGWGKTVLMRAVAAEVGLEFTSINLTPGTQMEQLVGMWRPEQTDSGIIIKWYDGVLSDAARTGKLFLADEFSRAPMEMTSRFFGLLDTKDRIWPMPEAGVRHIDVHEDFWMVATGNPQGGGYTTTRIDRALYSRFVVSPPIDKPLADEKAVLRGILSDKKTADKLYNWVRDVRNDKKSNVNTRDLVLVALAVNRGIDVAAAVRGCVAPKYGEENAAAVVKHAKNFFATKVRAGKVSKKRASSGACEVSMVPCDEHVREHWEAHNADTGESICTGCGDKASARAFAVAEWGKGVVFTEA